MGVRQEKAARRRAREREKVSVLRPAAYNPRKKLKPGDREYEKIKASIGEFGFTDPLVANADMTIIGGHQRLAVAVDFSYTEVLCAVVDVDKVREKALNIALNKITGAWDEELLADLMKDIQYLASTLGRQALNRRGLGCSLTRYTRRTCRRTNVAGVSNC